MKKQCTLFLKRQCTLRIGPVEPTAMDKSGILRLGDLDYVDSINKYLMGKLLVRFNKQGEDEEDGLVGTMIHSWVEEEEEEEEEEGEGENNNEPRLNRKAMYESLYKDLFDLEMLLEYKLVGFCQYILVDKTDSYLSPGECYDVCASYDKYKDIFEEPEQQAHEDPRLVDFKDIIGLLREAHKSGMYVTFHRYLFSDSFY
jgi:hypothetical protein